jgi:L-iditol 2-dehydrogenase
MRVGVYYNNSDVRVENRPVPTIGAGEVLMRVRASGICGSDVLEWYRVPKAPIVLGHEVAGDIVELGSGVDAVHVGDRVVVSHHVPCNVCPECLSGFQTACHTLHTTNFDPGGFAEFVRVPELQTDRGCRADLSPTRPALSEPPGASCEPACAREARFDGARHRQRTGLLHIRLALALGAAACSRLT